MWYSKKPFSICPQMFERWLDALPLYVYIDLLGVIGYKMARF